MYSVSIEESLSYVCYNTVPRPAPLPSKRNWQYTEYGQELNNRDHVASTIAEQEKRPFRFKLVCYNILAPDLLDKNMELYSHVNRRYLNWDYRRYKIYNELKHLNADVYCFQEMPQEQFHQYFLPRLRSMGYRCLYIKRTGRDKLDGCSICFKKRRFELVRDVPVPFKVPGADLLDRDNVGLIALLKPRWRSGDQEVDSRICVATTHLLYNPKRGDVKLAQLQTFLANLERTAFKKTIDSQTNIYYPTVLCGDFNLTPESELYKFLIESKLSSYKDLNRNIISGQFDSHRNPNRIARTLLPESMGINDHCQFREEQTKRQASSQDDCQETSTYGGDTLSHPFTFHSVYKHHDEQNNKEITSCTYDFKKNVDFILFHQGSDEEETDSQSNKNFQGLKLLGRLELFTEDRLAHISLPERNYPSDHFLLAAKFILE